MAFVYMVRCVDNSIYTGIARDLGRRMREHYYKERPGARYTKSRQIQSLEMVWETEEWADAARLEYRIKHLKKAKKEQLLERPERLDEWFGEVLETAAYRPRRELTLEQYLKKHLPEEQNKQG